MEDIINNIGDQVQIIFEKGEDTKLYRDAIWMTKEEYDNTSASTIDTIKQERYDNWLAIINAMPTESTDTITTPEE